MSLFFMFIRYFNGVILSGKSCQKRGFQKKYKKGVGNIGEGVIQGEFKPSAHYDVIPMSLVCTRVSSVCHSYVVLPLCFMMRIKFFNIKDRKTVSPLIS